MNKKVQTARLSIISNSLLILLKLFAGLISGSVSIISEAIHSLIDLLAAIIAFFSVKISGKSPDKEHPYGHGKFENISGVIESLLIFVAAIWIIYEAVHKLKTHNQIVSLEIAFIVMMISAILNFIVSRRLYKVATETDSVALEADALHLKTDVYTSLGVAIGILLIWITGYTFLDPVIAMAVALLIVYEAFILLKKAYSPLLDATLPDDEVVTIKKCIEKYCKNCITYENLRTRKSGHYKYIDFILALPGDMNVEKAHEICDHIESDIKRSLKYAEITIHTQPCDKK
ncbi:cation diffusion facilitator family transporter [Bacteroidota bacterium]